MGDTPYRVGVEDRDGVRVLTLDRPATLNAFTAEGYDALRARLEDADHDDGVAVCVLTGRGRAFSSGVDLSAAGSAEGSARLGRSFDPLLATLAGFSKPLLGAVNGPAVGFGATVLLHCDLVLVDERAEIRLPFVPLGTCMEAGASWLLPRRVGAQQAAWMILGGESLGAEQAVAAGLALAVAPAGRVVDEAVRRGRVMAAHGTAALAANKRLLRHGWDGQVAEAWAREKAATADLARQVGPLGRTWAARRPGPRPS